MTRTEYLGMSDTLYVEHLVAAHADIDALLADEQAAAEDVALRQERCPHLHVDYQEADPAVGIPTGSAVCEDCGQEWGGTPWA